MDLHWQKAVWGMITAVPANPRQGDRYILSTGGVIEYTATGWQLYAPVNGDVLFVGEVGQNYVYTDPGWVALASAQATVCDSSSMPWSGMPLGG